MLGNQTVPLSYFQTDRPALGISRKQGASSSEKNTLLTAPVGMSHQCVNIIYTSLGIIYTITEERISECYSGL